MEAELNPVDGTIALISPVTNAKRVFKRIDAGVAWGNPKSDEAVYSEHACVLVGLQEDDRINVLREYRGRMAEIIEKLIEWKDLLYLRNIHAPAEPLGLWRLLQDADGLTRYVVVKRDKAGRAQEPRSDVLDRFPTYRGLDCVASLRKIPETVLDDVFGVHTLADELIRKEDILVDLRYCHEIEKNANQPLNEVLDTSINKAMLWGINALWREALNEGYALPTPKKVKSPWKQFVRRK